jgi:hypothetical protein
MTGDDRAQGRTSRQRENEMSVREMTDRLITVIKEAVGSGPGRIHDTHSLTIDLGMDSLELMNLFALIERRIGPVDLMPWMVGSAVPGRDTVDSLSRYVATALPHAEWRRPEA